MKSILKTATAFGISALLLFTISNASAQHRGGLRVGIGIGGGGFGGGFAYRGYYRPYFGGYYGFPYPTIGLNVGYLPYGYMPFYYGPDLYYTYNGIYYRQNNDNYQVVAPPIGAEVPKLPAHAKSITINNEQYYVMDDVYYKEIVHPDNTKGYQIAGKDGVLNTGQQQAANAAPQVGDVIDQLPQDSREVNIAGKKYFVSPDDIYYQEQVDAGGSTSYKIVGLPNGNQNQNNNQNNNQNQNNSNNRPIIQQQ